MSSAAGSEDHHQKFHGHAVHGTAAAVRSFGHLAATTQAHLFREAQHFGVTHVTLNDQSWELVRLPNHTFQLRPPSAHGLL